MAEQLFDDEGQPNAWPVCAKCKTPYVYRWGLRLAGKSGFFWFADCKCKGADVETQTKTPAPPAETLKVPDDH